MSTEMRAICWFGLVAAVVAAAIPMPARGADTPSPICIARATPIPQGPAAFVSEAPVAGFGGRLRDVVLYSPALAAETHVYVLLPPVYDASGKTRYPVLYLVHG